MEKEQTKYCGFCGSEPDIEKEIVLIEGQSASICSECIEQAMDALKPYQLESSATEEKEAEKLEFGHKPSEVVDFLNNYIIGQDKAKMILAVAVVNHYKILDYKSRDEQKVELQKSNVLMAGPTGSGKTYFAQNIAKILDVPFAIADATTLTEAGYVGEDVENVVRKLLDAAGGDIEKAQEGIIYIDEIDKLSRKRENLSISRDVSGEGVQQALLKIIEGSEVEVTAKGLRKHPNAETIKINTSNILFIVGGSFEGIEKIIAKRLNKNEASIGFGAKVEKKDEVKFNDYILDIRQEDLKKFGMLPELLGRLPIIAPLQELDREALREIITEPKNAILKQYAELFAYDKVELEFTEDGIDAVADLAIERKTGARSLRSIMEETLVEWMYKLPDLGAEKIIFNAAAVKKEADPEIILKEKSVS